MGILQLGRNNSRRKRRRNVNDENASDILYSWQAIPL